MHQNGSISKRKFPQNVEAESSSHLHPQRPVLRDREDALTFKWNERAEHASFIYRK